MTNDERIAELGKCGQDFGFWISAYCKIEDKTSGGEVPFKLWPSQAAILSLFLSAVYLFILKARQLGLTWIAAAYCLWLGIFRTNQLIIIISEKEGKAIAFLDRVKFMFDRLPTWMRPHVYRRTNTELGFGYEEKDEKGNIVVKGHNSQIQSFTTTPSGAQSLTVNLLVIDEASLVENIRKIWRSSKPGVDSAKGRIIVISNPIKDGAGWPWFRIQFIKAYRGTAGRIKHLFLPWNAHPARGEDFIDVQKSEGYDDDDIAMHYPSTVEEAIEALTGSFFGKTLARHKEFPEAERGYLEYDTGEKVVFARARHGMLHVWDMPNGEGWRNRHCIFSDVSEGLDQTDSVAYVFDRVKERFIAKLCSNKVDADTWAHELIKLARWCGDSIHPMLCPERQGAGQTTIKTLRKEHYPRIFKERKEGRSRKQITTNYGWSETPENKKLIARALRLYFRDTDQVVPDGTLIDQCSTFIVRPNGTVGGETETTLDDHVIGAGGCLMLHDYLPDPKNLKKKSKRYIELGKDKKGWRERLGFEERERNPWLE